MSNCLHATDRMYTFQDQGAENRLPFSEEDGPDATQLPPGDKYEDEYSQPILWLSTFITIIALLLVVLT